MRIPRIHIDLGKPIRQGMGMLMLYLLSFTSFAAVSGPYVGAGLASSKFSLDDTVPQPSSVGLRGYGGYNLNRFWGVEAGVMGYAPYQFKNASRSSLQYSMKVFDLLGKSYFPLGQSGVELYGLAGAAAVLDKVETTTSGIIKPMTNTDRYHKLRPKAGLGISYAIPKSKVSTSVEFTHLQGTGNPNNNPAAIPSANTVMLNFTYNFD